MKARLLHDLQLDAGAADKDYFCLLHISLLDLILWNPESCASALELQTWSGLQQGNVLSVNFSKTMLDTISSSRCQVQVESGDPIRKGTPFPSEGIERKRKEERKEKLRRLQVTGKKKASRQNG
eukprot:1156284-Pelagomonas_calceolata.AAC.5